MPEETAEVNEETQVTQSEGEAQPKEAIVESKEVETKVETPEDIPVRPNASFIIERQKRTIEKLRNKETKEEVEEVDPIVARLDRIEEIALGQSDERDLQSFFSREPDAKKYEKRIKAYMQHDMYKGVDPEVIYHHLDYQDAKARVDSKRKVADLEANQTKSVGSSIRDTRSRDTKTAEDIKNMSDEEFKKYDQEQQRLARY